MRMSKDKKRTQSDFRLKKSKLMKMTSKLPGKTIRAKKKDKPNNLSEKLLNRQDNWKKTRSMMKNFTDLMVKEWTQEIMSLSLL